MRSTLWDYVPIWALSIGLSSYYLFPYVRGKYLTSLPEIVALIIFIYTVDFIIGKVLSWNPRTGALRVLKREVR